MTLIVFTVIFITYYIDEVKHNSRHEKNKDKFLSNKCH